MSAPALCPVGESDEEDRRAGVFRAMHWGVDGGILATLFAEVNSGARICGKIKPPWGRSCNEGRY